ncbi:ABC transporter ATP-binding protein [Candidatus Binatia bacterium]|nr:ABC transporter ATP-binding protein [Candidatus Binatia bacterium]
MIAIRGLHKSFGALCALKGIDLTIEPGRVTAIVGPNAAGKTTLMKSLVGLVIPDAGDIRVDGVPTRNSWAYRARIGYMPQTARFPENLSLDELLALVKDLRGAPAPFEDELVRLFDLHAALGRPLRVLSGGTRQRISAVIALMFDSEILILDEPTVGLDPLSSRRCKDRLAAERRRGKTIVLSSHVMSDLEELCERVVFLAEGQVYFDGTLEEIRQRTAERTLERAIARMMEGEGR